eukprot:CAMPEP_0197250184 /NCGR_PEP_ID=MMETSP1429-20130617/51645_1 /TAXON_ID=49237 /ORGANISM="Chaetoceros  sp., Strain UNC1202" /LENGTH=47 /DNA_ID= /DNA_START= /DNA_END= /DNA_ORIENTATION=
MTNETLWMDFIDEERKDITSEEKQLITIISDSSPEQVELVTRRYGNG